MSSFVRLKAITSKIGSGATPRGGSDVYSEQGVTFIRSQNVLDMRFSASGLAYINDAQAEKLKGVTVKEKDVLLNITGDSIARSCVVPPSILPARVNQHVSIIRCKDQDSAIYINYYLQYLKGYLLKICRVGGTRNALTKEAVGNLNVYLPHDHKARAKILFALDAKIDCNNRINAELEAMAKTLYDYWFVQFDFPFDFASGKPAQNGKPYKSSGGKMVYNPTLKREIPAGWKDSNILAVADLLGGGTPTKKKPEYWNGDIPFFTPTDADGTIFKFSTADSISEEGLKKSSTKLFAKNTVFITARGSVGKLVLTGAGMAMNQSCYALRAKPVISHSYLFFLAQELIHHLEVKSSGSVFDSIVSNDIEFTRLAIPDSAVVEKYAAVIEPAFKRIAANTQENQHLTQLRDWLLPMLMNGQVTVE